MACAAGSPGQVGADFPAVGSNFGPPSSGRIPLLLREGMADMRQTGFPAKVKKLIAERASATGDAADAYCEVWEVCHGARSGPAHHRRPRGQGGSRRRDTNLPSNGLSCCPRCHDWIENHRDEAKKHGSGVRSRRASRRRTRRSLDDQLIRVLERAA